LNHPREHRPNQTGLNGEQTRHNRHSFVAGANVYTERVGGSIPSPPTTVFRRFPQAARWVRSVQVYQRTSFLALQHQLNRHGRGACDGYLAKLPAPHGAPAVRAHAKRLGQSRLREAKALAGFAERVWSHSTSVLSSSRRSSSKQLRHLPLNCSWSLYASSPYGHSGSEHFTRYDPRMGKSSLSPSRVPFCASIQAPFRGGHLQELAQAFARRDDRKLVRRPKIRCCHCAPEGGTQSLRLLRSSSFSLSVGHWPDRE
jgi:hypothetical protein